MIDLIQSQLLDPFRIGLIVALVFTMFRTRAATGTVLPLAAGVIFVAVILPATQSPGQGSGAASLTEAVAAGVVSNLIILGIVLALAMIVRRLRG